MTLKKISEMTGVSMSTVSRVLANNASISEAVRAKVLTAAKELGYLDKINQRKSNKVVLRQILLVAPRQIILQSDENWVSFPLIDQLKKDCADQNIDLIPLVSGDQKIKLADVRAAVKEHNIDAIIIVQDDSPQLIEYLSKLSLPSVLINGEDTSMHMDTVTISNRFAGMMATKHLIKLNHQRILHITWDGRITITRRSDGYRDALNVHGFPVDDDLIIHAKDYTSIAAKTAMSAFLDENPDCKQATAIFCASDQLAIGVIEALKAHNLFVPNDISVLGFDDMLPLDIYDPPISTIHAPFLDLPHAALNILRQRITYPDQPVLRVELGCRLEERGSIRPNKKE